MLINHSFIQYLIEYHATRDYFQCHEIMEEFWKSAPHNDYSNLWVAFIQIAVAQYHDRRDNKRGAKRMYEAAYEKFVQYKDDIEDIDLIQLCIDIKGRLSNLNTPYYDFNFIIKNKALLQACHKAALEKQLEWETPSSNINTDVINRHMTRDRSSVIAERKAALKLKREQK